MNKKSEQLFLVIVFDVLVEFLIVFFDLVHDFAPDISVHVIGLEVNLDILSYV